MSQNKPSFNRVFDHQSGEDFFEWHPRMAAENFKVLSEELGRRNLQGVHTRADLTTKWRALEDFIAETQDECVGRILRPLYLPYDSLELPPEFDGLHVWLVSIPEASPEELLMLSQRRGYDAGYAHWPTLWELTSLTEFGSDTLPLNVYDLEHGRLESAAECGAVLVVYASKDRVVLTPMLSGMFDLTSEFINYKPFRRFELAELQASAQRERDEIQSLDVLGVWPRPVDHTMFGYESHRRTIRDVSVGRMDTVATLPQPAFGAGRELFVLLTGPAKDLAGFQDRLPSMHWMLFHKHGRPIFVVLCFEDTKPSALIVTISFTSGDTRDLPSLRRTLSNMKLAYEDLRTGHITEMAFPGSIRVQTCPYEPPSDGSDSVDPEKVDDMVRGCYTDKLAQRYIKDHHGVEVTSFAYGEWAIED